MLVDFQHHFTPREFFPEGFGDQSKTFFDKNGVPSYSFHSLLFDLDAHIEMMDVAGIDAAVLSCAEGMCTDLEKSKLINDRTKEATLKYPGRFLGFAHAHPLGGADAFAELKRCREELGFEGVVITTEFEGKYVDDPSLDLFWAECEKLGLFVFIHPALRLTWPQQFDAYDLARSVGREFSLVQAVIRLINGGVLDRFPNLVVQIAHLGGSIASVLGRIRSYQDKDFWGTHESQRHGCLPEQEFDWYLRNRLVFDTAGFCGDVRSVRSTIVELPTDRIVFASDYPQEIRAPKAVKKFVDDIRALGPEGEKMLGGNTGLLLKNV
ncbi:MAG: amidohydrolase family protein [Rickettsiales bacterium]